MQYILDLLLKQIFGQPFLLMAIIVFVGYIAMKQKFSKALMEAIKASIGIRSWEWCQCPDRQLRQTADSDPDSYRNPGSRIKYIPHHDSFL